MNIAKSKQMTKVYIDEYSNDGVLTPDGENQDYLLKHNILADKVQKELAARVRICKSFQITQNPLVSQLGLLQGFDIQQYKLTDIVYTYAGTKSYYFEIDNVGTVTIDENINGTWTNLKTINNTSKKSFTAYKGNIVASNPSNSIRVKFTGQYLYNIRNIALYAYSFPTDADVPDYTPYITYSMPSDFMELDKIIERADPRVYQQTSNYKIEGQDTNTKVILNYYNTGSYDIEYFAYPATIDDSTLDTHSYELPEKAAQLIPMKVAALTVQREKADTYAALISMYDTELSRLEQNDTVNPQTVQIVYGM